MRFWVFVPDCIATIRLRNFYRSRVESASDVPVAVICVPVVNLLGDTVVTHQSVLPRSLL